MKALFENFRMHLLSAKSNNFGNVSSIRWFLALITCVLGICMTLPANAACSITSSGGLRTANINFGNVSVPANAAVGTVIATAFDSYANWVGGQQQSFYCGANVTIAVSFLMSGTGSSNVFPTNIPGIGVRIKFDSYGGVAPRNTYVPVSWNQSPTASPGVDTMGFTLTPALVVTGPIDLSSTNTLSYNASPFLFGKAVDGSGQVAVSNLMVQATLASRSCSVTTPTVDVPLPTVNPGNLNTGSAQAKQFDLGVNCAQGVTVKVTLTDASNVSDRSTTLSLAPGSTATGVGLQILFGTTPVAFGPDSAVAGNMNQWTAGTSAGGPMTIPLSVRYIRTGTVNPGIVKGLATFTMSYQ